MLFLHLVRLGHIWRCYLVTWLNRDFVCRFFAPHHHFSGTAYDDSFNESLNNDGALDAYAETVVWRLKGVHAMVRYVIQFSGLKIHR